MRLSPSIATPVSLSLLVTLTGCHLSRTPSLAPFAAAVGLLGTHLLIALSSRYSTSTNTSTNRQVKVADNSH
jgi:hypothetical protein